MEVEQAKLVNVGYLERDPHWGMKMHSHLFHEMVVLLQGKMHLTIEGTRIHANKGDVLFYAAGSSHEEQSDGDEPVETIYFSWQEGAGKFPVLSHDASGRIRLLARWLYEEKDLTSPYSSLLQEAILNVVIAEFLRASTKVHDLVRIVRSFVRDHLEGTITLEDLARHVGISKYHLLRKYKSLTGRTPMQDLRIVRVEAARELILTTDLPLKAIAPKVGFANEYHLSRMFRKYLNLAPGYFRKYEVQ